MSEKELTDAVNAGELIEIQEKSMKKYQSDTLKVIHQDAEGLHRLGIISDKEMLEYDQDCLIQEPETSPAAPKAEVTEQVHA